MTRQRVDRVVSGAQSGADRAALDAAIHHGRLGDPSASRSAILAIVDSADPPLRVFLGRHALGYATTEYARRLAEWEQWQPVAEQAHGTQSRWGQAT